MYYYYITKEPRFLLIPGENVDVYSCLVPRPIAVVPILHKITYYYSTHIHILWNSYMYVH